MHLNKQALSNTMTKKSGHTMIQYIEALINCIQGICQQLMVNVVDWMPVAVIIVQYMNIMKINAGN